MMSDKPETKFAEFHVPTKPFSALDMVNRIAVGQGSIEYASSGAFADYNGHHVTVSWNDFRGYYITQFYWAGRQVLARGSAAECVRVALDEWKQQGRGATVTMSIKPQDVSDVCAAVRSVGDVHVVDGKEQWPPSWWTWKHEEAANAVRAEKQVPCPYVTFLLESETKADYQARIENFIAIRNGKPIQLVS